MKFIINRLTLLSLLVTSLFLIGCSDDGGDGPVDPPLPMPTGVFKVYQLSNTTTANIRGTATVREIDDGSITVELDLAGTSTGTHPAHIHANTAAEGGGVLRSLEPVPGTTGKSSINFRALDNGDAITYAELVDIDGYINIHLSSSDLTVVSQGDIGQNELTGQSTSYDLNEADVAGISGTAEFFERENGTSLLTISLNGTTAGNEHPAHIHDGIVGSGGAIVVGLTPVDGETGISNTQIEEAVGGGALLYDDIATIMAYINVHNSASDLGTIVANGNIGSSTGSAPEVIYQVTSPSNQDYSFAGGGLSGALDPDLTLQRGKTYQFSVNVPGHPFLIKTVQGNGTGNQYTNGVTNAGAVSGDIIFTVPADAPATLFYNCQFHSAMTGTFTIID